MDSDSPRSLTVAPNMSFRSIHGTKRKTPRSRTPPGAKMYPLSRKVCRKFTWTAAVSSNSDAGNGEHGILSFYLCPDRHLRYTYHCLTQTIVSSRALTTRKTEPCCGRSLAQARARTRRHKQASANTQTHQTNANVIFLFTE